MPVATHEISLHGISGAIFWFLLAAVVFFVLGFATVGWEKSAGAWIGLWATCSETNHAYGDEGMPFAFTAKVNTSTHVNVS